MERTATGFRTPNVIGAERTENKKLTTAPDVRRIAVTYATQASCYPKCPLMFNGCYAEGGPLGIITRRLNNGYTGDIMQVAYDHAEIIDALSGTVPLRLDVVGDCPNDAFTRIVSAACERYTAKHNMPVFAYTHCWRDVERASWGTVNVLASCDTHADIAYAESRGYGTAMAWDNNTPAPSNSFVCPQTTGKVADCMSCGLCIYGRNVKTVLFPLHGARHKAAAIALASA